MHPMSGYEIAIHRHRDSIRTAERQRLARRMRRLRRHGGADQSEHAA